VSSSVGRVSVEHEKHEKHASMHVCVCVCSWLVKGRWVGR
jgi:hypothetical protein